MKNDIVEIENFFDESDMQKFERSINKFLPGKDHVVQHGPFANRLISNYVDIMEDTDLLEYITEKMRMLFGPDVIVSSLVRVKLFLPWDIHSDYYAERCRPGYQPYYNLLAPLEDVDSRTIIFDQITDSFNDFHSYKQRNSTVSNPIDIDFWNDNLSMCWPEDRQYVSLKRAMIFQKRGQLLGFPRQFFHSSDNFHERGIDSKSFVQIRVDRPA